MAREIPQLARKLGLKVVAFEGQGEGSVDRPDFPGNLAGQARVRALQTFGKTFGKAISTVRNTIGQEGAIR